MFYTYSTIFRVCIFLAYSFDHFSFLFFLFFQSSLNYCKEIDSFIIPFHLLIVSVSFYLLSFSCTLQTPQTVPKKLTNLKPLKVNVIKEMFPELYPSLLPLSSRSLVALSFFFSFQITLSFALFMIAMVSVLEKETLFDLTVKVQTKAAAFIIN